MRIIHLHAAKRQFSKLIDAVSLGEEIVIAKSGKPVAMLVPVHARTPVRTPGAMKGRIRIADDFDSPVRDDLQGAFEIW